MMLEERGILSALGGEKALGGRVRGKLQLHERIEKGLPWAVASHLQRSLELTDAEFAGVLGVSERTLSRMRGSAAALTPVASDRLYRLARLFGLASEVLEDRAHAVAWLRRPQVGLSRWVPLELIRTEAGAREVEDLLGRIEYGVIS